MNTVAVWYRLEAWIPSYHAIGGKGYWAQLNGADELPYRVEDAGLAKADLKKARGSFPPRLVRLVRVTEEVTE